MKDDKLSLVAAQLARAAPSSWQEFLVIFGQYANDRKNECVHSSLDELPRSQGRAQLVSSLFDLFSSALKDADRIAARNERRSN